MDSKTKIYDDLLQELEETRRQLYEANETIEAIRTGQVDALVVHNGTEHQLYTLKTADHAYRAFIEKMPEGAVTLNREGVILYANSQFASMVSRPLSKVIGLVFQQFIVDTWQPFYKKLFDECWNDVCKGEVEIYQNNGSVPVQLSLTSLELDEGHSVSIVLTDLTVQKATQKQLEDNYRELEQLNKTLEASNHDLQQFASVASHDLQEPLRKIQMFANLVKSGGEGKFSDDEMSYLEKVIASANRMKTLIVDVLNYSRLSANDGGFFSTNLDVIVKDLVEDFELPIKEKKAKLIYTGLPVVEVNPGQIRQVFHNLISNALKFAKTGEPPVIEISCKRISKKSFDAVEKANGRYCLVCVKDNGIGFDEKYVSSIFSLFERLHPKDQYEGSGIGLAITKKIIDKHHGLIRAKSDIGKGSEFEIILPIKHSSP